MAIKIGDTVGYSKNFLQSTCQLTGDVPRARGEVINLVKLSDECILAEVKWNMDMPKRVHVKNLSTKKQIQLGN